jgi:hypothetical protein
MFRRSAIAVATVLALVATAAPADAHSPFRPGAAGIGDPYFPQAGNGGYDVRHYGLDIRYTPSTDVLAGVATITAKATQNLSSFNLDFDGLTLRSVTVNGRPARWTRADGELTVTPRTGLREGRTFTVVARYDGVPQIIPDDALGDSGVFHTDDGMVIVGQPHVASTWFPVNDHPLDKAAYTFRVTVPHGLEAVSNGRLVGRTTKRDWTTWVWHAPDPMASYLATATVGEFDLRSYRADGIRFLDAVDPDLLAPPAAPRTGTQLAISQTGEPAYKRLTRTIAVPAGGGALSFWVTRSTEADWDWFFVEARTAGGDDWTTLPDANGHSTTDTGALCAYAPDVHPFLARYLTPGPDGACTPTGSSGSWHGAAGQSDGYEQWTVDLSAWAGRQVEISLSVVNDFTITLPGVFVDDVTGPGGQGSTSFEADGDTLDGWTTPSEPPPGSPANPNTWIAGTAADVPPGQGAVINGSLARQPEIIRFLSETFGPYPFRDAGGIVDDTDQFTFALENQTRPIYARGFFSDPISGDSVVVHELAHQWYGDSLALARWQDIWLNEGFASYAEWLWSEREGNGMTQALFDFYYYNVFPADDEFWTLRIGDPGPARLFDQAVYVRGAMTMHALRVRVGDTAFFRILRTWATTRAGGNVTTPQFIALSERISGQQLDDLFTAWLYTPTRPAVETVPAAAARAAVAGPALSLKRGAARR